MDSVDGDLSERVWTEFERQQEAAWRRYEEARREARQRYELTCRAAGDAYAKTTAPLWTELTAKLEAHERLAA